MTSRLLPEGVDLTLVTAGPTIRGVAMLIDAVLSFLLYRAVAAAIAFPVDGGVPGGIREGGGITLTLIMTFVAIPTLFEILGAGRTPGKVMTRLRVLTTDGSRPRIGTLLVRGGLRLVDASPPVYGIGLVAAVRSVDNQRIGDRLAGTLVVRDGGTTLTRLPPLALAAEVGEFAASSWEIERLRDVDVALARRFLARRVQLPFSPRTRLAEQIGSHLVTRLALPAPPPMPPEVFIEAVIHASERHRADTAVGRQRRRTRR